VSYNLTDTRQVKLSYSRRISRPDPFWLSPFSYQDDARNVFRGNPALRPEYTDAYELGLQEARGWGSVQLNPYLRKTAHAVRFIRAVDTTGVTVATFANLASTTSLGTDFNVNVRSGRLTLFGGGSAWHYTSQAGALSTSSFVWSARSNATWKLTNTADATTFVTYRAPMVTEGGSQLAFVMTNFSLRQKLWGDQGSIHPSRLRSLQRYQVGLPHRQRRRHRAHRTPLRHARVFHLGEPQLRPGLKLRPRTQDDGQSGPPQGGPG
jgi:hypothetical protein